MRVSENEVVDTDCYVRRAFYDYISKKYLAIIDLGTLNLMPTRKESFEVIQKVVTFFKKNIIPIILGGGHDISYAIYRAYAQSKYVYLTVIDR